MRTPFSDVPVFVAIVAEVLAPPPIAVNTSSSIAVRSAAVCWYAFSALKIRSGVGRPAVDGVAMKFLRSLPRASILHSEIYCSNRRPAGILPHPATIGAQANARATEAHKHEARISPLAFAAPGHRTGRHRPRPLGTAAARLPHQRRRRVRARKPEHDRGARRLHRRWQSEILQRQF